jgi:DNA-binding Lrp family transcriptional regulator
MRLILDYLKEHNKASVAGLAEILNLSEGRVRAIFLEMTKEGVIRKVGRTKSAYYVRNSKL